MSDTKGRIASAVSKNKLVAGSILTGIVALFAIAAVLAWTGSDTSANEAAKQTGNQQQTAASQSADKQTEQANNTNNAANSGDQQVAVVAGSQDQGNVLGAATTQPSSIATGRTVSTTPVVDTPATDNGNADQGSTGSTGGNTGSNDGGNTGAGTTNPGTGTTDPGTGNTGGNTGTGTTNPGDTASNTGFIGGRVSLTFDDNVSSIYTNALPLLHQYQMKSTQYLISQTLKDNANYPGYFNQDQAKEFYSAATGVVGTELADHTMYHCSLIVSTTTDDATNCKTNLTAAQQTAQNTRELRDSKADLRAMFPDFDFNNIASPYGAYDDTAIAEIKDPTIGGYASHRSTDAGFNGFGTLNPYNIVVQNVEKATTLDTIKGWIDTAAANNQWLVLVYHDVADTADTAGDYGTNKVDLEATMVYLQAKQTAGLKVVTVAEALAENARGGSATTPTVSTDGEDTDTTDEAAAVVTDEAAATDAGDTTTTSDQPADVQTATTDETVPADSSDTAADATPADSDQTVAVASAVN